jgi:hypothetical protein
MVELNFLEAIMWRLGFSTQWTRLIMVCIQTVSCEILVNGQPVERIKPTIGIRQADQLSPYLFLICAEALGSLLHHAERSEIITGVPTSRKGPHTNHLFFTDDRLLFWKANSMERYKLTRLLEIYEIASG